MYEQESGSAKSVAKKPYVLAKKDRGNLVFWTGGYKTGGVQHSVKHDLAMRFRSAREANDIGSMSRGLARFRAVNLYRQDWPDGFKTQWWW